MTALEKKGVSNNAELNEAWRVELRFERDLSSGVWAIQRAKHEDLTTWLYAFQMGDDGPIKIGISDNPRRRLWSLQTASPYDLHPLACWRGFSFEERMVLAYFGSAHLRGEWFKPDPRLLEMLAGLGDEFQRWESA